MLDTADRHAVDGFRLGQLSEVFSGDMRGIVAIDLGCGQGRLAAAMARLGAIVVGIDADQECIAAARQHAATIPGLRYEVGDARAPELPAGCADLVICVDLLEQVEAWPLVVRAASRLLRPGGRLYVSTLDRFPDPRPVARRLAGALGLIPPGPRDAQRLIRPQELQAVAAGAELRCERTLGRHPRLLAAMRHWSWRPRPGDGMQLGFGAWFRKPPP